ESFYEYLIRTLGEFTDISEIGEVVIKGAADRPEATLPFDDRLKERKISPAPNFVLVKDVAKVKDTFKKRSSFSRYRGKENVSVSIQKQAQTNTIRVIDRVKRSFSAISKRLPPDVKLETVYDQSSFIQDAINGVRDAALQGGILAFIVLLVFLRNFKASAIVTLSIPISIVAVFTLMYFGGLSINMMSLGGLALGVGMLVDNAIVVIENIFRHREMGDPVAKAAGEGAEEVSNAIVASTLTTIAVFLPMIFVMGIAGQLFKELAFTVTFALIASLWVALTLIPLLSCKLGGEKEAAKGIAAFTGGRVWTGVLKGYEALLRKFLSNRRKGLLAVLGIFIASLFLFNFLEKELMPKTDQGEFIVKVDMPAGTRVKETNRIALMLEEKIRDNPHVKSVSSVVGATRGETTKDVIKRMGSYQAQLIVVLNEKRNVKTMDVVRPFQKEFMSEKYRPAKIEILMQQGLVSGAFGGGGKPVTIEVKGEKLSIMEDVVKRVEQRLKGIDGIFGVENDMPEPSPEVRMNIDKDKASLYNFSVVDLARIAQIILRGYIPSQFKEKGKEVDIRVILREQDRDTYEK
ncbi:MAG: efflux RND transporter permease subunit, partial [Candidatus Omnitrophica bacterium]|nr:efflux RND transporter permease subunit [Candidatus Omnitrophota bacterium]